MENMHLKTAVSSKGRLVTGAVMTMATAALLAMAPASEAASTASGVGKYATAAIQNAKNIAGAKCNAQYPRQAIVRGRWASPGTVLVSPSWMQYTPTLIYDCFANRAWGRPPIFEISNTPTWKIRKVPDGSRIE